MTGSTRSSCRRSCPARSSPLGRCRRSGGERCASSTRRRRPSPSDCSRSRSSAASRGARPTRRSGNLIERFKRENGVVFTVGTLEYLQKGGRIGRAQALAGTLLNVKPIMSVDDGVIHPIGKVRGRQKALAEFARVFAASTRGSARAEDRDRPRGCPGVGGRPHRPGRENATSIGDRARREPRRGCRHPRRPGLGRLFLAPGLALLPQRRVAGPGARRRGS